MIQMLLHTFLGRVMTVVQRIIIDIITVIYYKRNVTKNVFFIDFLPIEAMTSDVFAS